MEQRWLHCDPKSRLFSLISDQWSSSTCISSIFITWLQLMVCESVASNGMPWWADYFFLFVSIHTVFFLNHCWMIAAHAANVFFVINFISFFLNFNSTNKEKFILFIKSSFLWEAQSDFKTGFLPTNSWTVHFEQKRTLKCASKCKSTLNENLCHPTRIFRSRKPLEK